MARNEMKEKLRPRQEADDPPSDPEPVDMQARFAMYLERTKKAEYFLNQTVDRNIRNLVQTDSIPDRLKKQPIHKLIKETAKDLMMNQLELAAWSLYLERYVWPNAKDLDVANWILFSAFAAKEYLNDDSDEVKEEITKKKLSNFGSLYNLWKAQFRMGMQIHPVDLNTRFREIHSQPNEEEDLVDYRFYVDDILHIDPGQAHQEDAGMSSVDFGGLQAGNSLMEFETPGIFRGPSTFGTDQELRSGDFLQLPARRFSSENQTDSDASGLSSEAAQIVAPSVEKAKSLVTTLFQQPKSQIKQYLSMLDQSHRLRTAKLLEA